MRRFLIGFFAVVGVLSLLMVIGTGGLIYWAATNFRVEPEELPDEMILTLDLRGGVEENGPPDPFDYLGFDRGLSVTQIVRTLDQAREDPRVLGLIAQIDGGRQGFAVTQELRQAVRRFADSGRPTLAFADSFGELSPGNVGYYLATAFDEIHMQPVGLVGLTGLSFEMPFARETLEKIGVRFEVERRAEYKTALEFLTEDAPTPANAEMMRALLDDLQGQMVSDIAERRELTAGGFETILSAGPFSAEEARDRGLIDSLGYRDDARDAISALANGSDDWLTLATYAAESDLGDDDGPVVASITASGPIIRGESEFGREIGADTAARAIREAVDDPEVEAILMRVDSPGGSAVASETIGHEVERAVANGKPVVISMGDAAASGGYWISMKASHIVAEPATLTGSIGVVAGKPILGELWQKLGVNWSTIAQSDHATMWSVNQDYSPSEAARVEALVDVMYDDFKQGVSEGRQLDVEEVDRLARGRVWTGQQALDLGLVDELGGIFEAEAAVRRLAGLSPDEPLQLRSFPEPENPFDRVLAIVQGEFGRLGMHGMIAAFWHTLLSEAGSLPTAWTDLPKVR
ncbi:MAG: signal peptide peptidase SppA [Pseudomonadota bacterium]